MRASDHRGSDQDTVPAPGGRGSGTPSRADASRRARTGGQSIRGFLRANPQVFVLLVVCLVLGIGTFVIVLIGLATAGSEQTTGEPSGAILGTHSVLLARSLLF